MIFKSAFIGVHRRFLFFTLLLSAAPGLYAEVTPTAKEFTAEGVIRAKVQAERAVFAGRLDAGFLMETLAKKSNGLKLPTEPLYLYQEVDPVPLQSYKVFTPWLNHFKQSVVFVIGRLDPKRLKIARWSVSLHDQTGREIKTFSGVGHPPVAFYWNARDWERNPLAVGTGYIPEITLVDYYGAKVNLPQPTLYLDQFIWESPRCLRAGIVQDSVFQKKRAGFSRVGNVIMQELSNIVNQHDTVLLDIECFGPDLDMVNERAEVLKKYFAKENMRLKKIRIKSVALSGEPVFYIIATRLKTR
ncbi:hypothetical protein KAR34_06995 [bacterium]|nr:hypothetical protein [bacterium]